MNIPPKYEDVVAKLDAALGREAALRESLDDKREEYNKLGDRYDALQLRHPSRPVAAKAWNRRGEK